MKKLPLLSTAAGLAALLAGCQEQPKAYKVLEQGIAYTLKAARAQDTATARALERQAVERYLEALRLDSTQRVVRAALGHSYYLLDNYPQAIRWFEADNRLDSTSATNYRELGLSRISLGQVDAGWADLQRAFRLAGNPQIKTVTADDLYHLGRRAFAFGRQQASAGEAATATDYQQYAVRVLQTAYRCDPTRQDIRDTLATLAAQANRPLNQ